MRGCIKDEKVRSEHDEEARIFHLKLKRHACRRMLGLLYTFMSERKDERIQKVSGKKLHGWNGSPRAAASLSAVLVP